MISGGRKPPGVLHRLLHIYLYEEDPPIVHYPKDQQQKDRRDDGEFGHRGAFGPSKFRWCYQKDTLVGVVRFAIVRRIHAQNPRVDSSNTHEMCHYKRVLTSMFFMTRISPNWLGRYVGGRGATSRAIATETVLDEFLDGFRGKRRPATNEQRAI
jgi:hypothetical protein